MTNGPRVSVIIPAYNRRSLLPRALTSVYAQTRPADEVIVVDDGSTDDTAEVLQPWIDRGLRYVRKENGGASSARNRGIEIAGGDLLAFLDSDDEWQADKLHRQLELLAQHPSAGLCFCDAAMTSDGELRWPSRNWDRCGKWFGASLGIERGFVGVIDRRRFHLAQLGNGLIASPTQVVVCREVFADCGPFDSRFDPVEDYEMWLRASRSWDVAYVDATLATVHAQETSLTRRPELRGRFRSQARAVKRSEIQSVQDAEYLRLARRKLTENWETEIALLLQEGSRRQIADALAAAAQDGSDDGVPVRRAVRVARRLGPTAGRLAARLARWMGRARGDG